LRVLIDESLPVELAEELPFEATSTVRQQGWLGLRLRNRIEDLRPFIPRIAAAIPHLGPGDVTEIGARDDPPSFPPS